MRSSSFLVALQAGCLSLAAPTALGFGSHHKRCAPGSIEALEADYYHRSEGGQADHRKAVEMCIRLTLPAPYPENRPRVPSVVELVPCDATPDAPRSTQMYMRVTLPDSSIHEGHRTPSIVDPNPFANYSEDPKDGSGNDGPSHNDAATRGGSSTTNEVGSNNVHGPSDQGQTGSNGHSSNSATADKTSATQHQGLGAGNQNGDAGADNGNGPNGGTAAQESSKQNPAGAHEGDSSGPSVPPASDDASSGGDEDGSFRHGTLRASRPSPKSGEEAPTDDDSILNIKVHAAAFGGHDESGNTLPIDPPADKDNLLNIKVHAAALNGQDGLANSIPIDLPADKLLDIKLHAATSGKHDGPENVFPIDSLANRLLNVGADEAETTSGNDRTNEINAHLPSSSGSVAASLDPPSRPDLPTSKADDSSHFVNIKATTPAHDGNSEPAIGGPNAPEPHALLEVKGTTSQNADNAPSVSGAPVDSTTHGVTLLNVKGTVSPPDNARS